MENTPPVRGATQRMTWQIALLTTLALLLRVLALGHKPFWQDEVFSVLFVRMQWSQFWSILKSAEANMGLYYVLLRGWVKVFSGEAGIRLLSVIPGVLTVPVTYALGKRIYSRRVALFAVAFLTVNACAITYSQEARGYSLLVLFIALSYLSFVRLIENPSARNMALYIACAVCGFYSHFYMVFALLAQASALFFLPKSRIPWKALIGSWIASFLTMVPGLRVAFLTHGSNLWWLPRPGWLEIYHTLTFLAAEDGKLIGGLLAAVTLILVVSGLRTAVLNVKQDGRSYESFQAVLMPFGLLVPWVATMALSIWRPMFFHRFLIICLVPFLMVAAAGFDAIHSRKVAVALATGVFALSAVATIMSYNKVREDWRSAAAFTKGLGTGDPIVFFLKDGSAPFGYYRERLGFPLKDGQVIRCEHPPSVEQAAEWAKKYPRLWLVRFPAGPKDRTEPAITADLMTTYKFCDRGVFKGISVTWFSTGTCPRKP